MYSPVKRNSYIDFGNECFTWISWAIRYPVYCCGNFLDIFLCNILAFVRLLLIMLLLFHFVETVRLLALDVGH